MEIKDISRLWSFEKFIIKKFFAPQLAQKTNFFRLLALAQRSGLGLREALNSIQKSESNKWLIIIIQDLIDQLTQWNTFSQAISSHEYFFHQEEIALIKSAETMWNMPEILEEIANELESSQRINQKIKKALSYPIVLIVFAFAAIVILLIYVIPSIVSMFPSQESLPDITKFMLGASAFFQKTRYLIIIAIFGWIALYRFLYKYTLAFKVFIDKLMITIPTVSWVVKTYYMYRFSKLLSQLYSAGVSPVISLKLMANIFVNFFYTKKTLEIRKNLQAWFTFAESMEWSSLFDPILVQIIHVGEDTGNIAEVLNKMSNFYRDALQNKIDILMALIEPILMAFIAVIIGLLVASIFLPMADLVNVIK